MLRPMRRWAPNRHLLQNEVLLWMEYEKQNRGKPPSFGVQSWASPNGVCFKAYKGILSFKLVLKGHQTASIVLRVQGATQDGMSTRHLPGHHARQSGHTQEHLRGQRGVAPHGGNQTSKSPDSDRAPWLLAHRTPHPATARTATPPLAASAASEGLGHAMARLWAFKLRVQWFSYNLGISTHAWRRWPCKIIAPRAPVNPIGCPDHQTTTCSNLWELAGLSQETDLRSGLLPLKKLHVARKHANGNGNKAH